MQKLFLHALLLCSAILTYQYLTDKSANAQEVKFERVLITKTNYLAQQSRLQERDRLTKTNNYINKKTPASIFFQQQEDRDFVSSQSKANNGQQTTDNGRDAISRVSTDDRHVGAMAQVTSVSQLSDVQPTDWAFLALQSLVERYGCIAGYPDSSFRGNQALTRYEFAAGLNACLERVNELIATTGDRFDRKDLVTLQRLQEEIAAELSTLRGRVDVLEAQTAQLQANQFSTTTKLTGLAWGNVTGASAAGRVKLEAVDLSPPARFGGVVARRAGRDAATGRPSVQRKTDDPIITFSDHVWLNFNTSFRGKDSLVLQLAAGNGDSPANQFTSSGLYNTYGVPFFDQTAGIQGLGNDVIIRELSYSFPVGDFEVVFGPRINWYHYFDNNAFTFILTGANSFNSNGSTLLNAIDHGSGAAVVWKPSQQLKFAVGYIGENTEFLSSSIAPGYNTASDPNFGLFGGTYTTTAELTFSPSDRVNLRLLYNRSRLQQINGVR